MQANEQTDERDTQYLRPDSWLFWTTMRGALNYEMFTQISLAREVPHLVRWLPYNSPPFPVSGHAMSPWSLAVPVTTWHCQRPYDAANTAQPPPTTNGHYSLGTARWVETIKSVLSFHGKKTLFPISAANCVEQANQLLV